MGCYGLVFDGENLLMVKQRSGYWAGKWILPGGKLEMGKKTADKPMDEFASTAEYIDTIDTLAVPSGGFRRARASGISGFDTSYCAIESLRTLIKP